MYTTFVTRILSLSIRFSASIPLPWSSYSSYNRCSVSIPTLHTLLLLLFPHDPILFPFYRRFSIGAPSVFPVLYSGRIIIIYKKRLGLAHGAQPCAYFSIVQRWTLSSVPSSWSVFH
uniref:Uncharacterized protein n=1 Tax=Anopheles braziliensis TaxID=58242 RepID=A0A2M3ZLX6_9DIPT